MVSPTAADRVVIDDGEGGFREDLSGRPQQMVELSDSQYAVLFNPLGENDGGPNGKFRAGRNESRPVRNGTRAMIPGPGSFYLRPGQRVDVRDAHELASNQYLVVKVYGEVDTTAPYFQVTARSAAITRATAESPIAPGSTSPDGDARDVVLKRGQLIVIRGLDTQFFIPPTGVDIVPDTSVDESGATLNALAAQRLLGALAPPPPPPSRRSRRLRRGARGEGGRGAVRRRSLHGSDGAAADPRPAPRARRRGRPVGAIAAARPARCREARRARVPRGAGPRGAPGAPAPADALRAELARGRAARARARGPPGAPRAAGGGARREGVLRHRRRRRQARDQGRPGARLPRPLRRVHGRGLEEPRLRRLRAAPPARPLAARDRAHLARAARRAPPPRLRARRGSLLPRGRAAADRGLHVLRPVQRDRGALAADGRGGGGQRSPHRLHRGDRHRPEERHLRPRPGHRRGAPRARQAELPRRPAQGGADHPHRPGRRLEPVDRRQRAAQAHPRPGDHALGALRHRAPQHGGARHLGRRAAGHPRPLRDPPRLRGDADLGAALHRHPQVRPGSAAHLLPPRRRQPGHRRDHRGDPRLRGHQRARLALGHLPPRAEGSLVQPRELHPGARRPPAIHRPRALPHAPPLHALAADPGGGAGHHPRRARRDGGPAGPTLPGERDDRDRGRGALRRHRRPRARGADAEGAVGVRDAPDRRPAGAGGAELGAAARRDPPPPPGSRPRGAGARGCSSPTTGGGSTTTPPSPR